MTITNLKYTSIDETSIQVTSEDGNSYTAPWPCYTWHAQAIQEAIDSGIIIQPFKTEEEVKHEAIDKACGNIKAERDRRTSSGGYKVVVNNEPKWFHSDQASRTQQLTLFQLGDLIPEDLLWKTMDGSFVVMTKELAALVVMHATLSDQAIFTIAEQHKAVMLTLADPLSYDYSTGWPLIFGE